MTSCPSKSWSCESLSCVSHETVRRPRVQRAVTSVPRGFTLVEVIVGLAILSLVMLATVTGFRTLGNTAGTINKMTDRVDELRSVSSFLRDALENSVVGTESGGDEGLSFGGSSAAKPSAFFRLVSGNLEWRSKVLFGEAYGGSYFLRLGKRGNRLVLQWQDPDGRTEPKEWDNAPQRVVLDELELFEVAYRMSPGEPWRTDNLNRDAPSHIKLAVKANGRFWPEMIMQVQR